MYKKNMMLDTHHYVAPKADVGATEIFLGPDPGIFALYDDDIVKTMILREGKHCPLKNYMDKQPHITKRVRSIVVDWLIDVHEAYTMTADTLYLAIHTLDRYLSRKVVHRKQIQLVGIVAFFISAKYEETSFPGVRDIVKMCCNTYTPTEILRMEKEMIEVLTYSFMVVTASHYHHLLSTLYSHACKTSVGDKRIMRLMRFLGGVSLIYYEMVNYPASLVAAACLYLAGCISATNGVFYWSRVFTEYTGYTENQIMASVRTLGKCVRDNFSEKNEWSSVRRLYTKRDDATVKLVEEWLVRRNTVKFCSAM